MVSAQHRSSSAAVAEINRLGFQLHHSSIEDEKSTGLCAINIYICLMMVAAGSRDNNLKAFGAVLGFQSEELFDMVEKTVNLESYIKRNPSVELSSASSVWHKPGFILEEPWKKTIETAFEGKLGLLELTPINLFIERETKGKITNLVTESQVAEAVLMLVTCLYFKARWAIPFDILMTQRSASFYPFDSKPQTCAMMHRNGLFDYREDEKTQVCVLPYEGYAYDKEEGSNNNRRPHWKAAFVLPKTPTLSGLKDVLLQAASSPSGFRNVLNGSNSNLRGLRAQDIDLHIPRFKQDIHLNLKKPLISLGLSSVFQASSDFAPICATDPLMISSVLHDLVLEVNENGTEMAAVTRVSMKRGMPMKIPEMRVDRPFLFVVFDEESGLVLCSVAVTSLEEKNGVDT
jgi:serine protease inhibitor